MPVLGFNIEERHIYAAGRIFGPVGRYEKITGKVKFAVNPALAINKSGAGVCVNRCSISAG